MAPVLSVSCARSPKTTQNEATVTPTQEEVVQIAEAPEPEIELGTVYFDFDRAVLREDAKAALLESAKQVLDHPNWGALIIEGHCDERGTEEYNFALSERRATAVKGYLVALGVPGERLETAYLGEKQPAVPGHDEAAWKFNRRAELRLD